jgi:uncharacterized membrane protein
VRALLAVFAKLGPTSLTGSLVGALFFACSLTPSLIPRSLVFQGVVSGVSFAAGYALGVAGRWLWSYLELPLPPPTVQRVATRASTGVVIAGALLFLWWASDWQNSVRRVMELDEVSGIRPWSVAAIAALVAGAVLSLARLFRRTFWSLSARLERFLPRRVSMVLGVLTAVALFWGVIDRVLVTWALRVADGVSQQVDATIAPDMARPVEPMSTGSAASLIHWEALGNAGRRFVTAGPTQDDLATFHGRDVLAPIRVYVGLNAAETPEARAALALRELERVGAFERSVLLLVTPTGTGWVDPAALDPVEYLQRGDIASVAMQYSYLPSVLALPTEGAYGAENARALFRAVYGRWIRLPKDTRPALYLYGVSLGALNSDLSFDLHDVIADPFHGALWTGPPFRAEHWRSITANREPESPIWRPRFRGGSVVRFMNQQGGLADGDADWGPFRIAYLQYASDPMTFFSVDSLYREPAWLRDPRAFDVSPSLRWFPIVTTVQLIADMAVANTSPPGFGHSFAAVHYIDAWLALMEPKGWTEEMVARLKAKFERSR